MAVVKGQAISSGRTESLEPEPPMPEDTARRLEDAWANRSMHDVYESLVANNQPHPDNPALKRFVEFEAFLKTFRSDPTTGELLLTFSVPANQKYEAFRLTDFMMFRYRFDVYRAEQRRRRERPGRRGRIADREENIDGEADD